MSTRNGHSHPSWQLDFLALPCSQAQPHWTVEGGCLWMDSFDVQLSGVTCVSKKDLAWSYKLNSPGQCFMALLNVHGQFQALWGGYSPKIFNGDFLKIQQEFIETKLKGAVILANNHFSYSQTGFHSINFITTLSRPRGRPAMWLESLMR
jgi:hypothetical protein